MKICTATAFLVAIAMVDQCYASWQSVAVSGQLLCGGKKASGVRVKIVDDDTGLDLDDDLDEVTTDSNGRFRVEGYENEMSNIDVYLKIYHFCLDGVLQPCERRWKMKVPDHYITQGTKKPQKELDIGVWNLEVEMEDEERNCIRFI